MNVDKCYLMCPAPPEITQWCMEKCSSGHGVGCVIHVRLWNTVCLFSTVNYRARVRSLTCDKALKVLSEVSQSNKLFCQRVVCLRLHFMPLLIRAEDFRDLESNDKSGKQVYALKTKCFIWQIHNVTQGQSEPCNPRYI